MDSSLLFFDDSTLAQLKYGSAKPDKLPSWEAHTLSSHNGPAMEPAVNPGTKLHLAKDYPGINIKDYQNKVHLLNSDKTTFLGLHHVTRRWGKIETQYVAIPYFDRHGHFVSSRFRTTCKGQGVQFPSFTGKDGQEVNWVDAKMLSQKGTKREDGTVLLYGLQFLDPCLEWGYDKLLFVEGLFAPLSLFQARPTHCPSSTIP